MPAYWPEPGSYELHRCATIQRSSYATELPRLPSLMSPTGSRALRSLRYADLVALVVAAPILLLSGASAVGYGVGAASWLLIRALGLALESATGGITGLKEQIALWLGYRVARIFLLAATTIAVREAVDKTAGITALAVIASAFTIQLFGSTIGRHGRAQHSAGVRP
jgi:hypothetical protein